MTAVSAGHAGGTTTLTWNAPLDPGATLPVYEVLRSTKKANFSAAVALCMTDADPTDTTITDSQSPLPQKRFYYLIRATNGCADGVGGLGTDSEGEPRSGRSCP